MSVSVVGAAVWESALSMGRTCIHAAVLVVQVAAVEVVLTMVELLFLSLFGVDWRAIAVAVVKRCVAFVFGAVDWLSLVQGAETVRFCRWKAMFDMAMAGGITDLTPTGELTMLQPLVAELLEQER